MREPNGGVSTLLSALLPVAAIMALAYSYKSTRTDPKWRFLCDLIARAERGLAVFDREVPE
jgi:hypothetical protein